MDQTVTLYEVIRFETVGLGVESSAPKPTVVKVFVSPQMANGYVNIFQAYDNPDGNSGPDEAFAIREVTILFSELEPLMNRIRYLKKRGPK